MSLSIFQSIDLFQIQPNLYIPRTNRKTGRTSYSKKFGSLWGFSLTFTFLVIVLSYLIDNLFKMQSGNLDNLYVNILPFNYNNTEVYMSKDYNRFLPMFLLEPYDSSFDPDEFDIYKDGQPQVIDGFLNTNYTKLNQYVNSEIS